MTSVGSAVRWKVVDQALTQGLALLGAVLLARLLLPADFGLFVMVVVFIALAELFVQVGLASALIQGSWIVIGLTGLALIAAARWLPRDFNSRVQLIKSGVCGFELFYEWPKKGRIKRCLHGIPANDQIPSLPSLPICNYLDT